MGDNFWINFSQFFQFYLYGFYIFKHFKKNGFGLMFFFSFTIFEKILVIRELKLSSI